jgi:hypothetical protein
MALREIMRVPTDKLSMMAASEEGQRGPSVKTEQDRDQPKQEGDQPEAARDQPEAAAGDAAAGDQEEADDTMDNDGGGQDFKLEDVEAMDGGRVATKFPFTNGAKWRICTKLICETTCAKFLENLHSFIKVSLHTNSAKNRQFFMTVSVYHQAKKKNLDTYCFMTSL